MRLIPPRRGDDAPHGQSLNPRHPEGGLVSTDAFALPATNPEQADKTQQAIFPPGPGVDIADPEPGEDGYLLAYDEDLDQFILIPERWVDEAGDTMTGQLVLAPASDLTHLLIKMISAQSESPVLIQKDVSGNWVTVVDIDDTGSVTFRPAVSGSPAINSYGHGSSSTQTGAAFRGRGSRGTRQSLAALQSGDYENEITGGGQYDTTEGHIHNVNAAIILRAAENLDATHAGSFLEFLVTPLASTTIAALARLYATGLKIENGVTSAPDASAILELASTTQGLLLPRWTTTEKNNIPSPADGVIGYDTTLDAQCVRANGAWVTLAATGTGATPAPYVQTADATVANTVTETTIIGSGSGSLTLAAGFWTAGKTVRVRMWGFITDTFTPNFQIRLKLDAVTVLDTGVFPLAGGLSNSRFFFEADVTCRSTGGSGTVYAQGAVYIATTRRDIVSTATVTVDTTQSDALDITAQWGTASSSNTVITTNFTLEVLP
jgi:hypothetical protein